MNYDPSTSLKEQAQVWCLENYIKTLDNLSDGFESDSKEQGKITEESVMIVKNYLREENITLSSAEVEYLTFLLHTKKSTLHHIIQHFKRDDEIRKLIT